MSETVKEKKWTQKICQLDSVIPASGIRVLRRDSFKL